MEASEIIKKVRKIEIKTRGLSQNIFAGQYHSAFKGRGMAFSEVREYQYGDDVRDIDWNVTARFHRPYVKVYEEERELTVMLLVDLLQRFRQCYPWLHVILEPGSAFAWQTGPLVSQVVDVVEDRGIKTAILNVSFTCHMPDCLEMPYFPTVRHAEHIDPAAEQPQRAYRLGGNSCLSGDFMGDWLFDHALQVGENIIFEDMLHYTTVKTNMFNGISHPAIALAKADGTLQMLREFGYEDYRSRMD